MRSGLCPVGYGFECAWLNHFCAAVSLLSEIFDAMHEIPFLVGILCPSEDAVEVCLKNLLLRRPVLLGL